MRAVLKFIVLAAAVTFGTANAHTVSIGYANAGPGSVTFWYGSYHSCSESPPTEGSFNLVGINGTSFPSTTVNFALTTGTKPIGLIDGTTNFFATGAFGGTGPLSGVNPLVGGPIVCWQGVTFNNLAAGAYQFTYIPIANPTVKWAPWNTAVTTNVANLSQGVVSGVALVIPTLDPAMLALLALAVAGVAWASRRIG